MENLYGFFDSSSSSSAGFTSSSDHYSSSSMALPEQLVEYYRNCETLSSVIPPAAATGYNYSGKSNSSAAVSCCVNTAAVNQGGGEEVSCNVNDKIASHPLYPKLLQAYIDCQKVGAPPQIVNMLEEIRRESCQLGKRAGGSTNCMGIDPELDAFMETYCEVLVKYKSDLTKPFDEAITFLNSMETQLNTLANTNGAAAGNFSDEEDLSGGEIDVLDVEHQRTNVDHELKEKLLRKYSGYITSLKNECCKKRKKGKLPRDAKQILEDWWNVHCKWPYPTEVDKLTLAQTTGLDQKQINNWFINQRKRHWKPSENMQLAVMDSLYGPCSFYKD